MYNENNLGFYRTNTITGNDPYSPEIMPLSNNTEIEDDGFGFETADEMQETQDDAIDIENIGEEIFDLENTKNVINTIENGEPINLFKYDKYYDYEKSNEYKESFSVPIILIPSLVMDHVNNNISSLELFNSVEQQTEELNNDVIPQIITNMVSNSRNSTHININNDINNVKQLFKKFKPFKINSNTKIQSNSKVFKSNKSIKKNYSKKSIIIKPKLRVKVKICNDYYGNDIVNGESNGNNNIFIRNLHKHILNLKTKLSNKIKSKNLNVEITANEAIVLSQNIIARELINTTRKIDSLEQKFNLMQQGIETIITNTSRMTEQEQIIRSQEDMHIDIQHMDISVKNDEIIRNMILKFVNKTDDEIDFTNRADYELIALNCICNSIRIFNYTVNTSKTIVLKILYQLYLFSRFLCSSVIGMFIFITIVLTICKFINRDYPDVAIFIINFINKFSQITGVTGHHLFEGFKMIISDVRDTYSYTTNAFQQIEIIQHITGSITNAIEQTKNNLIRLFATNLAVINGVNLFLSNIKDTIDSSLLQIPVLTNSINTLTQDINGLRAITANIQETQQLIQSSTNFNSNFNDIFTRTFVNSLTNNAVTLGTNFIQSYITGDVSTMTRFRGGSYIKNKINQTNNYKKNKTNRINKTKYYKKNNIKKKTYKNRKTNKWRNK